VFRPSCEVAKLSIRRITSSDVPSAAALLAELGYPTTEADLGERLKAIATNPDDAVLVAAEDGNILGLVSVHSFEMIHRRGRLGRITSLIVAASARGRGLGTNLLAAAEKHLRAYGCAKLEVTSGEQRSSAHDFYAANGYKEERVRFTKTSDA
jgi:ribosomal protein S18 acetylase RimI-like enzyme